MAIEDFTTYTEVDASARLTVTASKATAANADRDIDVYLYDDKGVNNYNAININFEIRQETASLLFAFGGMGLTVSTVDSNSGWGTADIYVHMIEGASDAATVRLWRGNNVASDQFTAVTATVYYCTLLRTSGSDTVTLEIYSDSGRTTLLDTLSVAGFGTGTKYRYLYGFANNNDGTAVRDWDGFVQNMEDLSNKVAPSAAALTMVLPAPTVIVTTKPAALNATMVLSNPTSIHTTKPSALNLTMVLPAPIVAFLNVLKLIARFRDTRLQAVERDTTLTAGKRDTSFYTEKKT